MVTRCRYDGFPLISRDNPLKRRRYMPRILTPSTHSEETLAIAHDLLPPSWELKEGNAVPIYLRLVHEQNDAAQKYLTETPMPWNSVPVDKVPLAEARKFLQDRGYFLLR